MTITRNQQIENVAVAGGTGLLGSMIIDCLTRSGRFNITILSRTEQNTNFPGARLALVDYQNKETLITALQGQDAVVCALSRDATLLQPALIDAAVVAGVKRFIPSEFGGNLQDVNFRQLPNYKNKVWIEEYLESKCKSHDLTYTYVFNNVFLDWALQSGMLLDFKASTIRLYDGGERAVSMIRMPTAAQAVVDVLLNPEETKNRGVCIHEALLSQKHLLSLANQVIPDLEWKEEYIDLEELEKKARETQTPGVPNVSLFHVFAVKGGFGKGYSNQYGEADNELLGINRLSDEDIKSLIMDFAKKSE